MTDDIESVIQEYISEELLTDSSFQLRSDTPLLEGLVDSLGLQRLVAFLEDEFDLALGHFDMEPENFRTVRDIARFVAERVDGGAPGVASARP